MTPLVTRLVPRRTLAHGAVVVAAGAALVGVLAVLGILVPTQGIVALGAALLILVVGVTTVEPATVPVLSIPLLLVVERVGGGGVDLSLSDFVLFGAFWIAVILGPRPFSAPVRTLLWLSAFYQVSTLFTVVANPYPQNTIEWFHAWLSVGGAVVVGWAVGRAGYARVALTSFLAACVVVAVLTLVTGAVQLASGETGPVYLTWPYDMHKNFVGTVLAFGATVAYARPTWLHWHRAWSYTAFWLCAAGVVVSQARQALVALGVVLVVLSLRRAGGVRHTRWILLAVLPAAYYVVQLVGDQLAEGNEHNSTFQRLTWYQQTLSVWADNEWFGVGLRWWTAGRTEYGFQPPNAELEVASSAGTVGLVGFLVLMLGAVAMLWRVDPAYGTLAAGIVGLRFVQGQFDLFWVSVQVSVPFAIAGICLGALARDQASDARGPGHLVPARVPQPLEAVSA